MPPASTYRRLRAAGGAAWAVDEMVGGPAAGPATPQPVGCLLGKSVNWGFSQISCQDVGLMDSFLESTNINSAQHAPFKACVMPSGFSTLFNFENKISMQHH